jgi:CRP-like cAMP-binding protein
VLNISSIGQYDEDWNTRAQKAKQKHEHAHHHNAVGVIPGAGPKAGGPPAAESAAWKNGVKPKTSAMEMKRRLSKRGDQIQDTYGAKNNTVAHGRTVRRRKSSAAALPKMGIGGMMEAAVAVSQSKDLRSLLGDSKKNAKVQKRAAAAEKKQLKTEGVEGVDTKSVKGVVPDNLRRGSEGALRFMVQAVDNKDAAAASPGGSAKSRWGAAIKTVMKVQVMSTSKKAEEKVAEEKLKISRKMRMHRRLIDQPDCLKQPYEKVWVQSGAEYLSLSTKSVKEVFNKSLMEAERVKMLRTMGLACLIDVVKPVTIGPGTTFLRENDTKAKLIYILEKGSCMMYSEAHLPANELEAANAALNQEQEAIKGVESTHKASIAMQAKPDANGEVDQEEKNGNSTGNGARRLSTRDMQLQMLQKHQEEEESGGRRSLPKSAQTAECKAARENQQRKLACLGRQCIVGEISALLNEPQPTSCRTVTTCEFLVVDVAVFNRDVKANWEVAASLREAASAKLEMIEELKQKPYPLEKPVLQTAEEAAEEVAKEQEGRALALRLSDKSSLLHAVNVTTAGPADYKMDASHHYAPQAEDEVEQIWRPHGNTTSNGPTSVYTEKGLVECRTGSTALRRALVKRAGEQARPQAEETNLEADATERSFVQHTSSNDHSTTPAMMSARSAAPYPSPWGILSEGEAEPARASRQQVEMTSSVAISSYSTSNADTDDAQLAFDMDNMKDLHINRRFSLKNPNPGADGPLSSRTASSTPGRTPRSLLSFPSPRITTHVTSTLLPVIPFAKIPFTQQADSDALLSHRSTTSSFMMSARSVGSSRMSSSRTHHSLMGTPRDPLGIQKQPHGYSLHGKSTLFLSSPPSKQRDMFPSLRPVQSISNPAAAPRPTHKFDIWKQPPTTEYRMRNTGDVNVVGVGGGAHPSSGRAPSTFEEGKPSLPVGGIATGPVIPMSPLAFMAPVTPPKPKAKPTPLLQAINVKTGLHMF